MTGGIKKKVKRKKNEQQREKEENANETTGKQLTERRKRDRKREGEREITIKKIRAKDSGGNADVLHQWQEKAGIDTNPLSTEKFYLKSILPSFNTRKKERESVFIASPYYLAEFRDWLTKAGIMSYHEQMPLRGRRRHVCR